ncbi:MAG: response regulator [Candidatus Thermoplasmatota archaeon]|nr:response regulator [Candidatus Thermoplasmatota archaeon]
MTKRLLIVEDEQDMQNLMQIYLQRSGLDVELHQAFTGEEGVSMYQMMMNDGASPHLVIMDLKLPGIDGVEATRRIVEMDPGARIYGFTAFFETIWATKLREAGAQGVIPRPIGFDGFIDKIRDLLQE